MYSIYFCHFVYLLSACVQISFYSESLWCVPNFKEKVECNIGEDAIFLNRNALLFRYIYKGRPVKISANNVFLFYKEIDMKYLMLYYNILYCLRIYSIFSGNHSYGNNTEWPYRFEIQFYQLVAVLKGTRMFLSSLKKYSFFAVSTVYFSVVFFSLFNYRDHCIFTHPKTLLDFKHLSDSDVVDVCRPKISDLGEDIN